MYTVGDARLQLCEPLEEEWDASPVYDARNRKVGITYPVVYLPHSCDEWVIGGPTEVRLMIGELKELLQRVTD